MKKVTYQTIRELIPPTNPSKIARVLHHLANGNTLNSIQAETELNEHSLPSTISTLKNKYGFEIIRTDNPELDRFMVYTLDSSPESLQLAFRMLLAFGYRDPQRDLFNGEGGNIDPQSIRRLEHPDPVPLEALILHWLAGGETLVMVWGIGAEPDSEERAPSPDSEIAHIIDSLAERLSIEIQHEDMVGSAFTETGEPCRLRRYFMSPTPQESLKCYQALTGSGFTEPRCAATPAATTGEPTL